MKKFLFLLLFISSCPDWVCGQSSPTKRALNEIAFDGSGYALGYVHGSALKNEIAAIVRKWKENTSTQVGRNAEEVITEFFAYAHFTETIKQWTPDLYEEVRGIADGSGQKFNDIFILNLLDEFWVYFNDPTLHHCSSMGVPSINGSDSYVAQNMDIENYTDGYQTLIHLSPGGSGPKQMLLTFPGLIVLNGMNDQGVGVCVNTLMQLKASPEGLPVAFVVRRILQLTDKKDIQLFMHTVPHASGQNYLIGIRGELFDYEASANKVVPYNSQLDNEVIYHTNHPLVNDDYKSWYIKDGALDLGGKPGKSNSELRLNSLEKRVAIIPILDDPNIKKALSAKDDKNNPVCRSIDSKKFAFTFASTIMTLTGTPYLQITAGPPDESEFRRIEFRE